MSSCGFAGYSDAYGLGVRLGLYLQWVSTLTAGLLAPEELGSLMAVNTTFTFAVLIILIYSTATKGDTLQSDSLYAVEAFILIVLCLGGSVCGMLTAPWPRETSSLGRALREWLTFQVLLLSVTLAVLNIYAFWLYFVGIYHTARLSCGDNIFMFTRANLFGPFRILALVIHSFLSLGAIELVALGVLFLWPYVIARAGAFLRRLRKAPVRESELGPTGEPRGSQWESQEIDRLPAFLRDNSLLSLGELERRVRCSFFVCFVLPIISIIEVTIKYNDIQGVQNININGQLLPLSFGVLGFLQLLSKVKINRQTLTLLFNRTYTIYAKPWPTRFSPRWSSAESEELQDEAANPNASQADEDNHRTQPSSEDAPERRNMI